MKKEELMRKAIELSIENVANGGGPFANKQDVRQK